MKNYCLKKMNREVARIRKTWMYGKNNLRIFKGLYSVVKMKKKVIDFQDTKTEKYEKVMEYIRRVFKKPNFANFVTMCFNLNMYPRILMGKSGKWKLKIFDNLCIDLESEIPTTRELEIAITAISQFIFDIAAGYIDDKNCSKIFRKLMKNIPSYCVFYDVADDGFILYIVGRRLLVQENVDFEKMPDSPEKLRQKIFKICKPNCKKIENILLANFYFFIDYCRRFVFWLLRNLLLR